MPDTPLPYLRCPPLEGGAYGPWRADTGMWRPYVRAVARRHGIAGPRWSAVAAPGCHPVFAAASADYIVKFYAPHWPCDFAAEAAVYASLVAGGQLPVPRVLARGALFPDAAEWVWPYLVTSRVPGRSVAALHPQLSRADRLRLARDLGVLLRTMHRLPAPPSPEGGWRDRVRELRRTAPARRRRNGWPAELVDGLAPYFAEAFDRADPGPARLVHGDVHDAHVLLERDADRWAISGLIDFADAVLGDPAYELVPLYVNLFRCDAELLRAFLEAYGPDPAWGPGCRRRATAYLLLFDDNKLPAVLERVPPARSARTPHQLEAVLWQGVLE